MPRSACLRAFQVARECQLVVLVEGVGEFFADEMPQQILTSLFRDIFAEQREAQRFTMMQPLQDARGVRAQFRGVILDKLDRSQHLAVPRRLQEAHILRVGFDDIQQVEIHMLIAQSLAKLAGNQEVADDRRGGAVDDEEGVSQQRI